MLRLPLGTGIHASNYSDEEAIYYEHSNNEVVTYVILLDDCLPGRTSRGRQNKVLYLLYFVI